jgi:hypothetical protein
MRPHGHNKQEIGAKEQTARGVEYYITKGTIAHILGEFQMKRFLLAALAVIREGIQEEPLGLVELPQWRSVRAFKANGLAPRTRPRIHTMDARKLKRKVKSI